MQEFGRDGRGIDAAHIDALLRDFVADHLELFGFWDGLPADLKEPLARAVKETTDYFNETAAKDNADAIDKIRASGKTEIHILTEEERKAWIGKLMPVHTEMQSRFGKDFIERIYKASGFTPPQS